MTKQILLADDDADDRLLFEEVFAGFPVGNFNLISVANGEEVLGHLNNAKGGRLPDLIILDQNMPILSGRETAQNIKRSIDFADIPIVIYSTYNDSSFIRDCISMGITDVVSKPDSFEGFVEMVKRLLSHSGAHHEHIFQKAG